MQVYIVRLFSTYVKEVAGTGLELELPLMAIALEKRKKKKKENATMTSHITNTNIGLHLPREREEEERVILKDFFRVVGKMYPRLIDCGGGDPLECRLTGCQLE